MRQYPIKIDFDGNKRFFIADFYCNECKLVVEIDGGIHEERKELDADRSYLINNMGIRVVRYDNEYVMSNISEVLGNLKRNLEPGEPPDF